MKFEPARRIILLNYNSASGTIDWRHYLISVPPVGVYRNRFDASSKAHVREAPRGLPDLFHNARHLQTTSLAEPPLPASMANSRPTHPKPNRRPKDVADPRNKVHPTTLHRPR